MATRAVPAQRQHVSIISNSDLPFKTLDPAVQNNHLSNRYNSSSLPHSNTGITSNASDTITSSSPVVSNASKHSNGFNSYRIKSGSEDDVSHISETFSVDPIFPSPHSRSSGGRQLVSVVAGLKSYSSTDLPPTSSSSRKPFKTPSFPSNLLVTDKLHSADAATSFGRHGYNETGTIKIPKAYEKAEPVKISTLRQRRHTSVATDQSYTSKKHRFSKASSTFKDHREIKHPLSQKYVIPGRKVQEGHHNYILAYNMITGIRVAVSRCSQIPTPLVDDDYKQVSKMVFHWEGSQTTPSSKYEFKFKDYAPKVFRDLRGVFHVDQADYLLSLTEKVALTELGSPGKSGSFFYYSRDYRFIIKTIHHSEHLHLRRILKQYHDYVVKNPGTLLCQFYGLHRLKMHTRHGIVKLHILVMNNIFPPTSEIHQRYDLKGSTCGRYTDVENAKKMGDTSLCLKDLNFLRSNMKIHLGPDRRKAVLEQLRKDVSFLESTNTMDYSLLLGVHNMTPDDINSPINQEPEFLSTRDVRTSKIFVLPDGGIRAADDHGNEMPVIYYMAVIDCLTNYSTFKKLETFFRSMKHRRSTISAIPPREYGHRFYSFMEAAMTQKKKFVI